MERKNLPEGIISEEAVLTLNDLSILCGVDEHYVVEMVEMGILEPEGRTVGHWQFSIIQMLRFQTAQRLQADLDINLPGVALGIELLDEIKQLRADIKKLENQLKLLNQQ